MEENGWKFVGIFKSKDINYQRKCGHDTWYGYRTGSSEPASVSATFEGSGRAKLIFGNCWEGWDKTVDVYLSNAKIATANANVVKTSVTFDFFKGSTLRIEVNGAIIKIRSLDIVCNEQQNN